MGERSDGMLRLIEKLKENGVEMALGPRSMSVRNDISVTFRKWSNKQNQPFGRRQQLVVLDDLRKLNMSVEDVLIYMLDDFMKEFEERENVRKENQYER